MKRNRFVPHYNKRQKQDRKTILITGASSGIGLAVAYRWAREGYRLVLVASNRERLSYAAKKLERRYPTCVVAQICQDLSKPGAAVNIYGQVKARNIVVDTLVNNAGFGMVGEETELILEREREMLAVNITALTELTHLFLRDMYQRKQGKILNVASVGAFQPGPYTAAYYASKSYVASYSRAIRYEAAKHGVQVCTLCPGSTKTAFFQKTGSATPIWSMSPEKVAVAAYKGLDKNREIIVPGAINQLLRLVPSGVKLWGVAKLKSRG